MTGSHLKTASERAAAKAADVDDQHPGDRPDDEVAPKPESPVVESKPATAKEGKSAEHRHVGGSSSDKFNLKLIRQTLDACWFTNPEEMDKAASCAVIALAGIAPRDEIEGMLASQLVATHAAAMECSRRAMIMEQNVESRAMNLKYAAKASQTFAALLETLDRHRGRAPQRVVVEHRHLHFHSGSQESVGQVEVGAAGGQIENKGQPYEQGAIGDAHERSLQGEDQARDLVHVPRNAKRTLPASRRAKPGRADG